MFRKPFKRPSSISTPFISFPSPLLNSSPAAVPHCTPPLAQPHGSLHYQTHMPQCCNYHTNTNSRWYHSLSLSRRRTTRVEHSIKLNTANSPHRLASPFLHSHHQAHSFNSLHDPFHDANSRVFNDATMKQYLPKHLYDQFLEMIRTGVAMDDDAQEELAIHLQSWGMERGATTFSHLFTPIRGNSASRKEAFISRSRNGDLHKAYIGKNLFMKERIAISSYPGQSTRTKASTLWDVTSPPYVHNHCLYLPALCRTEYGTIDEKTPHLRSQKALRTASKRLLSAMKDPLAEKRINSHVSWEQEFYVVPKDAFLTRPDLIQCSQTLVGTPPHKGRGDHYFSKQPEVVQRFLNEVQNELWQMGVPVLSSLSEVSFGQHELCSRFVPSNIAADHNLLLKELMGSIANKFNLHILFHEKPFKGLQGSSTHMNWSIETDDSHKLFAPGNDSTSHTRFLVFIAALIRATHLHQDCIRVSCASSANDMRLASKNENPSTIMSLSLGETLTSFLRRVEERGVLIPSDTSDKELAAFSEALQKSADSGHRSSPFPWTGSSFEFRCNGARDNLDFPICILNTILADSLDFFAQELEAGKSLDTLIVETLRKHSPIIYNGDSHSKAWEKEAQRRQLLNLKTTPHAFERFKDSKNKELFSRNKIFSAQELAIRSEVKTEQYIESFLTTSSCLIELMTSRIIPAAERDSVSDLSLICRDRKQKLLRELDAANEQLRAVYESYPVDDDALERAFFCSKLEKEMDVVRGICDELESYVSAEMWPLAKIHHLLLSLDSNTL